MTILGIETSSRICSVALTDGDGIGDETSLDAGLIHSEKLIPLMDALLKKNKMAVGDIGGIAVSTGPGSFTGIRVGVSAARGFAQSLGIPLTGISSLDGLANKAALIKRITGKVIICPVIDALREEVYTALYRKVPGGVGQLADYNLVNIKILLKSLKRRKEKIFFLGDAVDLYAGLIRTEIKGAMIADNKNRYASALSVAAAGMKRMPGDNGKDYTKVLPLYIRKPEAEIKWRKK